MKYYKKLNRIERKCDAILDGIKLLRKELKREPEIDSLIDRMHRTARSLRAQCHCEKEFILHGCFRMPGHEPV